jgi:hypothetical protein
VHDTLCMRAGKEEWQTCVLIEAGNTQVGCRVVCYSLAYHGWPRLESSADDACAMGGKRRSTAKTANQAPVVSICRMTTASSVFACGNCTAMGWIHWRTWRKSLRFGERERAALAGHQRG